MTKLTKPVSPFKIYTTEGMTSLIGGLKDKTLWSGIGFEAYELRTLAKQIYGSSANENIQNLAVPIAEELVRRLRKAEEQCGRLKAKLKPLAKPSQ
jgi:hypothetical protein